MMVYTWAEQDYTFALVPLLDISQEHIRIHNLDNKLGHSL
jgi:hypothetical protein